MKRLLVLLTLVVSPLLHGDQFVVTSGADSGKGSLRQAILDANAHPGQDMIVSQTANTVVLKSPLPVITDGVSIGFYGGETTLTIDGRGAGAAADGLVCAADECSVIAATIGGFGGAALVFRGKRNGADGVGIGITRTLAPLPNGTGIRIEAGADVTIGKAGRVFVTNSAGNGIEVHGTAHIADAETDINGGDGLYADSQSPLEITGLRTAHNGGNGATIRHTSPPAPLMLSITPGVTAHAPVVLDDVHGVDVNVQLSGSYGAYPEPFLIRGSSDVAVTVTAQDLALEALRVENSTGVVVGGSITGGATDGIRAIDSDVRSSAVVTGNRGHGIYARGGSLRVARSQDPARPDDVQISGNGGDGIHVERGKVAASHAVIHDNGGDGVALLDHTTGSSLSDTVVVAGNGGYGVHVDQSSNNTISVRTEENRREPIVISGSDATGNVVDGAMVERRMAPGGVLPQPLQTGGSGRAGVLITGGASDNRVSNSTIAFANGPAVGIESGHGNRVTEISAIAPRGLPVDLGVDGPSAATPPSAEAPNHLQPAPVLTGVKQLPTFDADMHLRQYTLSGVIPGATPGMYTVELYVTVPSEWHALMTLPVVVDAAGRFTTNLQFEHYPPYAVKLSATATDDAGDTSEMSSAIAVTRTTELHTLPEYGTVAAGKVYVATFRRSGDADTRITADWLAGQRYGDAVFAHGSVVLEPGVFETTARIDTSSMETCPAGASCGFEIVARNVTGALAVGTAFVNIESGSRVKASAQQPFAVTEGDGMTAYVLTLERGAGSDGQPVTVTYHTEPGTATEGVDYTPMHGTVTIPADQVYTYLAIPIIGDHDPEPDETFRIVLDDGTGPQTVTITIFDDDTSTPPLAMVKNDHGHLHAEWADKTIVRVAPIVTMDVVRLTPFGEQFIGRGAEVGLDLSEGPVDVRLSSGNARLETDVLHFDAASATLAVEPRTLTAGTRESVRIARLTPVTQPLDVAYTAGSASGTLHFDAGDVFTTAVFDVPDDAAARTGAFSVTFPDAHLAHVFTVTDPRLPLISVSGPVRDGDLTCVMFEAERPVATDSAFGVHGDWMRVGSIDGVLLPAGTAHASYCTDHPLNEFDSWVSLASGYGVRVPAARIWIGSTPHTRSTTINGPTIAAPSSGTSSVDFVVTFPASLDYAPGPAMLFRTVDGTAVAGRDYIATIVSAPDASPEVIVHVPILATGSTETRTFFLVSEDGAVGAAVIVPPGHGMPRRRPL